MMDSRPQSTISNPSTGFVGLFSSVKVGLVLLGLLIIYSAVGSAGIPVSYALWEPTTWVKIREHPWLEMTEMEWFQWWPFVTLIALTCLVMAVTTIRRIPLNWINAGVWMVHVGLITLAVACVVYFSSKVEGDVPVARAQIHIEVPGGAPVTMLAMPGNATKVHTDEGDWSFRVTSIDPEWELLSGDDKGERAHAVTVSVQPPAGHEHQMFMRQLLDGYPQYTEDIIRSSNAHQPMARAKKTLGRPLVDDTLKMSLQPAVADRFYLQAEPAIYVREVTGGNIGPWIQRPVHDLPRFSDRVRDPERVWVDEGARFAAPIDITVKPVDDQDPLKGVDLRITDYLRHARLKVGDVPVEDGPIAPAATLKVQIGDGAPSTYELFAMEPEGNTAPADIFGFEWIDDEAALRTAPELRIEVPAHEVDVIVPVHGLADASPAVEFQEVEGTPFSWRVRFIDDQLKIADQIRPLAQIELTDGEMTWKRWAFEDPSLNGDLAAEPDAGGHDRLIPADPRIVTTYRPATGSIVPFVLVAGPDENQLRLISRMSINADVLDVEIGETIEIAGGAKFTVTRHAPRTRRETRPQITPWAQRDPRTMDRASMMRVETPGAPPAWLSMHQYAFDSPEQAIPGMGYAPTTIRMHDGRVMQLLYSRQSKPIGGEITLDGFRIKSHVGGFTGTVSSVLNWISELRFDGGDVVEVSVNDPQPYAGLWFFQSQWDPPDPRGTRTGGIPSAGRNYTVLGVGNRWGVWTMLFGAVLSTIGMIWAFYVKPVLRRRQMERVTTQLETGA
ncbi:MAG: hypothetical protein MK101_05590 [Phycisphaerales bacterium]|nr:hypothetical protein [Phycisphaerales bacterium]